MPAWNEPSPRNPSLERQDLTAKQAFSFTNSTIFGGIASARDDWVSNANVIPVFRPRRMVCTAKLRRLPPVGGIAEQLVALGEQPDQRPQVWVLLGQRAGDLLRPQLGQPGLPAADLGVGGVQRVQRGGDGVLVDAAVVAGQAGLVGVE